MDQSPPLPDTDFQTGIFLDADPAIAERYLEAERSFLAWLHEDDLDAYIAARPASQQCFEDTIAGAIDAAYDEREPDDTAHLFLQRLLYRINRLQFFWYDELRRYDNERSVWLQRLRARIEEAWQPWEQAQFELVKPAPAEVAPALERRAAEVLEPPWSADGYFFRGEMTYRGYRRLLALASLDGLVEASQLSRILGGASNGVHATLTRLLAEEYGFGHLERKHSTYFTRMLTEAGMNTAPEAYFDLLPWELLALSNQSFLYSERKRYFLRYIGGLLYFETSVPSAFIHYKAAAERLGVSEAGRSYWDLHIHADERHGRWMLNDVALPLVELYPDDAWEMILGFDQQRAMSARAGAAVVRSVRSAEQTDA